MSGKAHSLRRNRSATGRSTHRPFVPFPNRRDNHPLREPAQSRVQTRRPSRYGSQMELPPRHEYLRWDESPFDHIEGPDSQDALCGLRPTRSWANDDEPVHPLCPDCRRVLEQRRAESAG
jgi:hypothetical protein